MSTSRWLLAVVAFLVLASPVAASPVRVTTAALASETGLSFDAKTKNETPWLYMPGDDPSWKEPGLDDSAWEARPTGQMRLRLRPNGGWPGIGWYRVHLDVDPEIVGKPVSLSLSHNGASETYLDGRLVRAFGTVSSDPETETVYDPNNRPIPIVFDAPGDHVLAIRYSCAATADGRTSFPRLLTGDIVFYGVSAGLQDAETAVSNYATNISSRTLTAALFCGILAAFGVLHFLLYLFDRRQVANLLYSLFALSFGLNWSNGLVLSVTHLGYGPTAYLTVANRCFVAGIFVFFLAFLFAAFKFRVPKLYWALVGLWTVGIATVAFARFSSWVQFLFPIAIGLSILMSMVTFGRALKERRDGAWIIGTGIVLLAIAITAQLVGEIFGIDQRTTGIFSILGFLGLPLCVSIYLARTFARTSRDLEAKLVEVETLSAEAIEHQRRETYLLAENERRAAELEEARQLQLSMLPAVLPNLPGLEVAAYMKPATEVGGDYYDFHVAADGTLTVAVGDATGHGLKAGTLVTATKGLFNAFADEPDILSFFRRSSRALKLLNLRYLYMALMLAKVKENRVRISAAGMPPTLVFHAATGEVEEIAIRGLPLGGGTAFPYEERALDLEPGDTLVFMSDGFPERFNTSGEMLDYDRARAVLAEVADRSPREIIDHFVRTGDAWADGQPQDDDVTFVVLKRSAAA